ncbi:NAD-dependent epimerase/dehydratase family protein [Candidatus Daviesbacteria bacterium]|nr:NAD-dependent epimerase/dehydratase family protein [Candidatus Daviesbacteria bacterium]
MGKKALITGGAGFIGSHIQDKLIKLGHQIAILDNLRSGKKENLNPQATFFNVDIRSLEDVKKVFDQFQPEIVFHLAAQNEVPYSMDHPIEDEQINIEGTINILEASKATAVKQVIYSNTGGAFYGDVEESDLPIKEDHIILKPTSFYGVSKHCAEEYLKLYGNLYGIDWVSLRYSNVYGPRQDGNKEAGVVAIFTQKLLNKEQPTINGDGRHTRDYVHVFDVVEANIKAMNYDKNDFFNISTGVRTSNLEVFQTIEEELKTSIEVMFGPERAGDALHSSLSPRKAKELLLWQPKYDFKSGIKQAVEYYLKKNN